MEDTVLSVLCDKLWAKDADAGCSMKFRKDGTGDILCARELSVFIDSEFEWKLQQGSASLSRAMDASQDSSAELHIELTITKRPSTSRIERLGADAYKFDDDFFSDEVFLPKSYTVRLEKGRISVNSSGYTWWYGLRLVFDKSPYPPPELWNKRRGAAEGNLFHERIDFYAEALETIHPDGHRIY
ncbi:hypothetical protein F5X99DRAFT_378924 [Biscogniauxia marginata]|nr:hypothetical protein F5X99DRAFT_378924 [Biscogniauxia marginata]